MAGREPQRLQLRGRGGRGALCLVAASLGWPSAFSRPFLRICLSLGLMKKTKKKTTTTYTTYYLYQKKAKLRQGVLSAGEQRFLLVRHGQTTFNAEKRFQGGSRGEFSPATGMYLIMYQPLVRGSMDEDSVLTAKGISQAEELGQWLKASLLVGFKGCTGFVFRAAAEGNPVAAVFVSPLLRARQTLEVARTVAGAAMHSSCTSMAWHCADQSLMQMSSQPQARCCRPRRPSCPSCARLTSTSQKLGESGISGPSVDLQPAISALGGGRAERRTRSGQRIRNS